MQPTAPSTSKPSTDNRRLTKRGDVAEVPMAHNSNYGFVSWTLMPLGYTCSGCQWWLNTKLCLIQLKMGKRWKGLRIPLAPRNIPFSETKSWPPTASGPFSVRGPDRVAGGSLVGAAHLLDDSFRVMVRNYVWVPPIPTSHS